MEKKIKALEDTPTDNIFCELQKYKMELNNLLNIKNQVSHWKTQGPILHPAQVT